MWNDIALIIKLQTGVFKGYTAHVDIQRCIHTLLLACQQLTVCGAGRYLSDMETYPNLGPSPRFFKPNT